MPHHQEEDSTWTSLKHGLQVGAGFFVGYFLMRFLTLVAMIAAGLLVMMFVCVPKCEEYDRKIVAPLENKAKIRIVNMPQLVWPKGCIVRDRPSRSGKAIGQVFPGRVYTVKRRKRGWVKVGGFAIKGWVGCRGYAPHAAELQEFKR